MPRTYQCVRCTETFPIYSAYESHQRQTHQQKVTCTINGKRFDFNRNNSGNFTCPCKHSTSNPKAFGLHFRRCIPGQHSFDNWDIQGLFESTLPPEPSASEPRDATDATLAPPMGNLFVPLGTTQAGFDMVHSAPICLICNQFVPFENFKFHFTIHHRGACSELELVQLLGSFEEDLETPVEWQFDTDGFLLNPVGGVPLISGFKCPFAVESQSCTYAAQTTRTIKRHLAEKHSVYNTAMNIISTRVQVLSKFKNIVFAIKPLQQPTQVELASVGRQNLAFTILSQSGSILNHGTVPNLLISSSPAIPAASGSSTVPTGTADGEQQDPSNSDSDVVLS